MTNFDPGGLLVLLTVIPSLVAGAVSIAGGHVAARLGYGRYEANVAALLGLLLLAWIAAALVVSTAMLTVLAVVLAMAGAYLASRDVAAASYGWVLGVVLLYVAFAALAAVGLYHGVDSRGRPVGVIARNVYAFYAGGLFACGAVGGAVVGRFRRWRGAKRTGTPERA